MFHVRISIQPPKRGAELKKVWSLLFILARAARGTREDSIVDPSCIGKQETTLADRGFIRHSLASWNLDGSLITNALIGPRHVTRGRLVPKSRRGLLERLKWGRSLAPQAVSWLCPLFAMTYRKLLFSRHLGVGQIKNPKLPLAKAVAASSAFPPILSPCQIDVSKYGLQFEPADGTEDLSFPPYTEKLVLSDGGVYDNLGLETAWKQFDTILVSDGGGHYDPQPSPHHDWLDTQFAFWT